MLVSLTILSNLLTPDWEKYMLWWCILSCQWTVCVAALLWWCILSVLKQQIFVLFFVLFLFFSLSLYLFNCWKCSLFGFLIENKHCAIAFLEIFVLLSLLTWLKVGCSLKRGDNFINHIMAITPHCGALFKCMWTIIMSNPKMNGLILRT